MVKLLVINQLELDEVRVAWFRLFSRPTLLWQNFENEGRWRKKQIILLLNNCFYKIQLNIANCSQRNTRTGKGANPRHSYKQIQLTVHQKVKSSWEQLVVVRGLREGGGKLDLSGEAICLSGVEEEVRL